MSEDARSGFWITNRVANPVVRRLLRNPLGRRLGRRLALVRYRGRRTGREYELPVQYVRDDARVWIVPAFPERKTWWRNLRGGADVELHLAGQDLRGRGVALEGPEQADEVVEGLAAYLTASPRTRKAFGLAAAETTTAADDDVLQLSQRTVVIRVDLEP